MTLGLGLDTGGTNTDAVIMDLETDKVLSKAKSPTTKEDLSIGVRKALKSLDQTLLGEVSVASLSSTLATNSVVEGKGCRVALICIGQECEVSVHVDARTTVAGGHNNHGGEEHTLDETAVREFLGSVRGKVDAVAVTGVFATRNPSHEDRVRAIVREVLDIPAVCGHDLSSKLGVGTRASTCIVNAKLIPIMERLISSVKRVFSDMGLDVPLTIVRGNGSLMSESLAKEKPIETVLSGPSASLIGAMTLTGRRDAVVLDIGGTTTDIGVLRNGTPRLTSDGMRIGGTLTHINAARVATAGIGGDSRILVNGRKVVQSSVRAIPLCVASMRWDSVKRSLNDAMGLCSTDLREKRDPFTQAMGCELFTPICDPDSVEHMTDTDRMFMDLLRERPLTADEAAAELGTYTSSINSAWLENKDLVQRIAFTPTDLLHVLGRFSDYDREASVLGAEYLAKRSGKTLDGFLKDAEDCIKQRICTEVMRDLIEEEMGSCDLGAAGERMLGKAVLSKDGLDFGCRIHLNKPMIGIGAPAGVLVRWAGEALDAEVLIHPDSDVGNAVGAITATLSESIVTTIRPENLDEDSSPFEIFTFDGRHLVQSLDEAHRFVEEHCGEHLAEMLKAANAQNIRISTSEKTSTMWSRGREILSEIEVTMTATGHSGPFEGRE